MRPLLPAVVLLPLVIVVTAPLGGQELRISGSTGPLDGVGVIGVWLDTPDDAVTGYGFDVCHDEELVGVEKDGVVDGAAIADLEFLLHTVSVEEDGLSVAATLAADVELGPSSDLQLYEVSYSLFEEGLAELDFCGSILEASVTIDDDDITPFSTGSVLEILDGEVFLRGDANADGNVQALFDGLYLLRWGFGDGAAPPCLEAADSDGGGSVSALIDALTLFTWMHSDGGEPPAPGPEDCGIDLDLDDDELACEEPAEACGGAHVPTLDTRYTLALSEGEGTIDDRVTLTVSMSNECDAVAGFQLGICHGPELEIDEDDISIGILEPNGDRFDPFFDGCQAYDGGWTYGVIIDATENLDDAETDLATATYTVLDDEVPAVVEFCDTLGDPPVQNGLVNASGDDVLTWVIPAVVHGGINLVPKVKPVEFLRGDCNGDGTVAAIPDALFVLRYQFQAEAPAPPCLDAADVDNTGTVSGLADGLYLLRWQFGGGDDPVDPGPLECGPDPDEDDELDEVDCAEPPECL